MVVGKMKKEKRQTETKGWDMKRGDGSYRRA